VCTYPTSEALRVTEAVQARAVAVRANEQGRAQKAAGKSAAPEGRGVPKAVAAPDEDDDAETADTLHASYLTVERREAEFVDDSTCVAPDTPRRDGEAGRPVSVGYTAEQAKQANKAFEEAFKSRAELEKDIPPIPSDRELRESVRESIEELYEQRDAHPRVEEKDFGKVMREIREMSLDVKYFKPGTLRLHIAAWEELFTMCEELGLQKVGLDSRGHTRTQRKVLKALREKPKYERRHIKEGSTGRKRAAFAKKRHLVKDSLVRGLGLDDAEAERILSEPHSSDLHMPNRKSCFTDENFGDSVKGLVKMIMAGGAHRLGESPRTRAAGAGNPATHVRPVAGAARARQQGAPVQRRDV
jgi:hypothetical protein